MIKYSRWTVKEIEDLADKLMVWTENPNNDWLGDFAVENGTYRQKLEILANQNEKFMEAYKYARAVQESRLMRGALKNKYNSFIVTMALKNFAGWKDKTEQDVKTSGSVTLQGLIENVSNTRKASRVDGHLAEVSDN